MRIKLILLALLYITASLAPAIGAPITYDVSFRATNFVSINVAAPVDPVVGSFQITLDPTVAVVDDTADITFKSLNIALDSPLSFTYNPAPDGLFAAGTLPSVELSDTADTVQYNPSTNDFWLQIGNFATAPTFIQVGYSQTSVSSDNLFYTLNSTGSTTVAVVPEPSSMALAIGGVALVTIFGLRRQRGGRAGRAIAL